MSGWILSQVLGVVLIAAAISAVHRGTVLAEPGPAKRALLVAISDYESKYPTRRNRSAWKNLHTRVDAERMQAVLIEKYGFKPVDILVLEDEKATRKGIEEAFRKHLIEAARPGDVAVFMYSGHGQQVPDDNGDNDEQDGLDESLVPYDYISADARENARANFRDDDLQKLLKQLSERMRGADGKVAGNITVVIDSCSSGTIVRGNQITKGRGWDEAIDGPRPRPRDDVVSALEVPAKGDRAPREGRSRDAGSGLLAPDEALATGYVLFSACQSYESAYEVQDEGTRRSLGGALIYHLCAALREATPRTTYRDLYERVKLDVKAMRLEQTPAVEGEIHQLLFSGVAQPAPTYPLVESYRDGVVHIGAGRLHGVTEQSRYALYRAGTDPADPANRLTEVTVTRVDAYRSRATLPERDRERFRERDLRAARAVPVAIDYPDQKLRVLLEGTEHLASALKEPGVAELEDALQVISRDAPPQRESLARGAAGQPPPDRPPHDVRITLEPASPTARGASAAEPVLVVRRDNDVELVRIANDASSGPRLRERLLGLWRWRFLAGLHPESTATPLQVELRVVPVQVIREAASVRVGADRTDFSATDGQLVLTGGDYVRLEIVNRSAEPVYASVLNLQPDGTVALHFPDAANPRTDENRIPAGDTLRIRGALRVQEPYGTDVFKVIATPEPVDFSSLIYQPEKLPGARGATARGQAESTITRMPARARPLARLLLRASTGRRGFGREETVDPEYWGTASVLVETRAP